MTGALRLFVAIELPVPVQRALAALEADLRRDIGDKHVRWVRPEGIHLTLRFLGEVAEDRESSLHAALREATVEAPAFEVALSGLGHFGGRGGLRVIWVGLRGDTDALTRLAGSVVGALVPLGFEREKRPFSGHLTLGRVRDGASASDRRAIAGRLEASPPLASSPAFPVVAIALMRSILEPEGARYERRAAFRLA